MTKKTDLDLYAVIDQYHDRVRKFILITVKDEWIADDLVQETFLRAYKNLNRLQDQSKVSAWLFRTAYNLCMDHFRSASRRSFEGLDAIENKKPAKLLSIEKELERSQMSHCIQDKALLLSESYRTVI